MKYVIQGELGITGTVSTLAVEWIEIFLSRLWRAGDLSPPSRWSGLKYLYLDPSAKGLAVSTLAVEWIEIRLHHGQITVMVVVSTLAVEWIEIAIHIDSLNLLRSPPSRWSGLKY